MIDQANEALRAKGYSAAQLYAESAPMANRAYLKGTKILSPLADTPETILRVAQELVPAADELGRRQITPHEIRSALGS